jgi:hypothetical protein
MGVSNQSIMGVTKFPIYMYVGKKCMKPNYIPNNVLLIRRTKAYLKKFLKIMSIQESLLEKSLLKTKILE